jgi:hypothetical protein
MSLGWNVDFVWGAVMVGFGLICLWLTRRHVKKHGPSGLGSQDGDRS